MKENGKDAVLVTGASSGIGYEFAKLFAQNGHDLVITARSDDRLMEIKAEIEANSGVAVSVIATDLTATNGADGLYRAVAAQGIEIGILLNNAGFGDNAPFLDSDWNKQQNMICLNVTALARLSYLFGNDMRARGHGRILNVSSVAAFMPGPYMSVYFATKAFVLSFSHALYAELKNSGVTVTALCPGPTATGFEKAAGTGDAKAFDNAANPADVAKRGYNALMKGKPVVYHGAMTKFVNLAYGFIPRTLAANITGGMNKKEKDPD